MGFLNFLRNLLKEEAKIKENKKIKFEELSEIINNKKQEYNRKQETFRKETNNLISDLTDNLKKELPVIKQIDLSEKRVEERVRFIVNENLNYYINHLEKLIEDLRDLESKQENLIENINFIFSNFERKSNMNFEKATFLIGKELGKVKENISKFFRNLNALINKNKEISEKGEIIKIVSAELEEIQKIDKTSSLIRENITDSEKKINQLKNENEEIEKNIKRIENSVEYEKEKEKIREIEKEKKEIKKEIFELKENIDLKSLANIFHSNEKEMNIIKSYKSNFYAAFIKNNGKDLIELLKEEEKQPILNKFDKITELQKDIEKDLLIPNQDKINQLGSKMKRLELEMTNLAIKISRENKKIRKIEENQQEIINSIRRELIKLNLELE